MKKAFTILLCIILVASLFTPNVLADDGSIIRVSGGTTFDGEYDSLEEYTTAYATASYTGSIDVPFTVMLLDDLIINADGITSAGLLIGSNTSDSPSVLDLGGHTITVAGVMGILVGGQSHSPIVVRNGNISINSSNASAITCIDGSLTLSEITLTASDNVTNAAGVIGNIVSATQIYIENSIFNLGTGNTDIMDSGSGNNKTTIVSGQFGNLNINSDTDNIDLASGSLPLSGLDTVSGTVITSDATTAIIVDNGNAYLYDTLQDAVDAASRRADDSGNVNIQLLKQPTDAEVRLPDDAPEGITITKLNADDDITLGNIQMTDSDGNAVSISDDGKLETIIAVESVTLDKTSLDLYVGNTAELNATVEPENAADKIVTWSSSDPTVATVDTNGNVKALKPGTTTITATAGGKSDTCTVTVSYPVNIPDTYDIELIVGEGGEAKTSLTNASAGSTITVAVTPDEGYELDYITVDGERIDGTTFTMPEHDVTVRVYFTDGSVDMPFVDVNTGDWFYDYVAYVYVNGLMDGTSATTFEPNANMTRVMVWTILARIDGETITGANWVETAREWAMASGVSDGENANGYVTREQLATMLYRYAVAKGYDVSIGESTNILSYADFASISEYAIPAMQWVCGSGIVTGVTDSTLVPQGTATRAQCAAMLMRFVEL